MKSIFSLFFIIGALALGYSRPMKNVHSPPGVNQLLAVDDQAVSPTDRVTYDFSKSSAAIHNYAPQRWDNFQLAILKKVHQRRYEHWAYLRPSETHSDYT